MDTNKISQISDCIRALSGKVAYIVVNSAISSVLAELPEFSMNFGGVLPVRNKDADLFPDLRFKVGTLFDINVIVDPVMKLTDLCVYNIDDEILVDIGVKFDLKVPDDFLLT